MDKARVDRFLSHLSQWAATQNQVQGVALVGSYARDTATDVSDIDLVVLVDDPHFFLRDRSWLETFGKVLSQGIEHYGNVVSLRVHYEGQLEVEFGLTDKNWAEMPPDPGTRAVMSGMRVVFERGPLLSRHVP